MNALQVVDWTKEQSGSSAPLLSPTEKDGHKIVNVVAGNETLCLGTIWPLMWSGHHHARTPSGYPSCVAYSWDHAVGFLIDYALTQRADRISCREIADVLRELAAEHDERIAFLDAAAGRVPPKVNSQQTI